MFVISQFSAAIHSMRTKPQIVGSRMSPEEIDHRADQCLLQIDEYDNEGWRRERALLTLALITECYKTTLLHHANFPISLNDHEGQLAVRWLDEPEEAYRDIIEWAWRAMGECLVEHQDRNGNEYK